MEIEQVKDAVEELGRTWRAFREENDKRAGRDDERLAEMNGRLDRLEATLRRAGRTPAANTGDGRGERDDSPEAKAYFDYLRFGTRDEPNPDGRALTREAMKALTVGADPTAGYLAPVEYAREIIKGETEFSPLREVARIHRPGAWHRPQLPSLYRQAGPVRDSEVWTRGSCMDGPDARAFLQ